jgi:hypothetical protein
MAHKVLLKLGNISVSDEGRYPHWTAAVFSTFGAATLTFAVLLAQPAKKLKAKTAVSVNIPFIKNLTKISYHYIFVIIL